MKKTIKKRAFVSAIAMLIVSAIVLTSSTFAWFSMSKQATVDSMDLTVSSPEGIQISANASAWTANLTIDEIFNTDDTTTSRYDAYEGNTNLYPTDLVPVSSAFEYANSATGVVDFYKATLNDTGFANVSLVSQTAGNADNAGLISFDLFFKVAQQTTVYFGTSEFVDNSSSDVLTALRVGFTPLGNLAIGSTAAEAQALKAFTRGTGNIVYEVDSMKRSADATSLGQTTGRLDTKYLAGTGASGQTTNGILDNSFTHATAAKLVRDTDAASVKSFTLNAGVTKMRVFLWVEGNDVDCQNSIAGAAFTAALKFTID
ncbi:MAG: hypothetical protein SPI54_00965 [Oscillospiraceae bacterium]|nr:hypothetical protein [Oscillospiraceae bacterium]